MENDNDKPLVKKVPAKKNIKRASKLAKLENRKLYPMQERIGIYIITFLSAVGLSLIGYTGIMAVASTSGVDTTDVPSAELDSGIEAEDIHEILNDLDLEESLEDTDSVEETTHEYEEPQEGVEAEDGEEDEEDGGT